MKKNHIIILTSFFLLTFLTSFSQATKKIVIEHSDYADVNEAEIPGALLLTGNVRVNHDGAVLTCNKAYFFKLENYIKALGNVQIVQGDTLFLNSNYAEYNGEIKQALASGNATMRSPDATLYTDTIHFDRNIQEVFYKSDGTIINKETTLKSKSGRYFVSQKKFQFLTSVVITNPTVVIKSNHLDYYSNSGHSYLFDPSTITSKVNYIYTEKGFYDTKKNLSHFLKKSYIRYNDRLIEGDSLYYDRNREFASATRNVKITDSVNRGVVRGHYGEVYKNKDSMFVTKRAVAVNFTENDSIYIHGKILLVTGKEDDRIIRAYHNVRFYKTNMSGKCDSLHSSTKKGLTKLIGNPVVWNGESQITGDLMHIIGKKTTQQIDSLKVLNNTFVISKDSIGTGYNQTKGINLYGKFEDGKLHYVDVVKNAEMLYYMRNDIKELIGINKNVCTKISLILEDSAIKSVTFFNQVDGTIYPEGKLLPEELKLKGFNWRADERIKSKDDIFSAEENIFNEKMIKETKIYDAKKKTPIKVRKETINYGKKS